MKIEQPYRNTKKERISAPPKEPSPELSKKASRQSLKTKNPDGGRTRPTPSSPAYLIRKRNMQTLPPEIVDMILAFVGPLPHARIVCRQWRHLIDAQRGQWRPLSATEYMGPLGQHNACAVIEWARTNGCPWDASACAGAAKGGHLGLLQWLRRSGCPWDVLAYGWAMARGHTQIADWLIDNKCPAKINDLWKPAICGGHIEIVGWLLEHGHSWPRGSCRFAARSGRLDLLQRARSEGVKCQFWDCCPKAAAKKGHIHILEWLHGHGEGNFSASESAAAWAGRLDVIEWIVAQGHPLCVTTMMNAAGGGHRHVIEWLRNRGEQWYGGTTGYAAKHGHFDLLVWLYEQGCQLSTTTFLEASRGAPISILEWLRDRRCPLKVKDAMRKARTDEAKALIASCAHLDVSLTRRWSCTIHDDDDNTTI
jgi:hypothetical protein